MTDNQLFNKKRFILTIFTLCVIFTLNIIISKFFVWILPKEIYFKFDCNEPDISKIESYLGIDYNFKNELRFYSYKCHHDSISDYISDVRYNYRKLTLEETNCQNSPLQITNTVNRWKNVKREARITLDDVKSVRTIPLSEHVDVNWNLLWTDSGALIDGLEKIHIMHKKSGLCLHVNNMSYIDINIKKSAWKEDQIINASLIRLVNCRNDPTEFSLDEKGLISICNEKLTCLSKWPSKRLVLNDSRGTFVEPLIISKACKTFFKLLMNMVIDPVSKSCVYPDFVTNIYKPDEANQYAFILGNKCTNDSEFITVSTKKSSIKIPFENTLLVETQKNDQKTFLDLLIPLNAAKNDGYNSNFFKESNNLMSNDVLLILVDHLSSIQFDVTMQQTNHVLTNLMKGIHLRNFVGNNFDSPRNSLFSLIFGSEKINNGTVYNDNLFHLFFKSGYKTFLSIDSPSLSEYFKTLLAYVNYSDVNIWSKMTNIPLTGIQPFCFGSVPRHDISIDLLSEFWKTYDKTAKFAVVSFIHSFEQNGNSGSAVDGKLALFLSNLQNYDNSPRSQPPIIILGGLRPNILTKALNKKALNYHNLVSALVVSTPDSLKKMTNNIYKNKMKLITNKDLRKSLISIARASDEHPYDAEYEGFDFIASQVPERNCFDLSIDDIYCPCKK